MENQGVLKILHLYVGWKKCHVSKPIIYKSVYVCKINVIIVTSGIFYLGLIFKDGSRASKR